MIRLRFAVRSAALLLSVAMPLAGPRSLPVCAADAATIDYNRDIRPILSNHCFACHGPDEANRQGGLRLDEGEAATQPADSGQKAIVPGKPDESQLVSRI